MTRFQKNCFGEELEKIHTCLKLQHKQLVCNRTIHRILDTWHDWIFATKRCSVRQKKRICFHGYPIVLYSLRLGSYHTATYSTTGATPQKAAPKKNTHKNKRHFALVWHRPIFFPPEMVSFAYFSFYWLAGKEGIFRKFPIVDHDQPAKRWFFWYRFGHRPIQHGNIIILSKYKYQIPCSHIHRLYR